MLILFNSSAFEFFIKFNSFSKPSLLIFNNSFSFIKSFFSILILVNSSSFNFNWLIISKFEFWFSEFINFLLFNLEDSITFNFSPKILIFPKYKDFESSSYNFASKVFFLDKLHFLNFRYSSIDILNNFFDSFSEKVLDEYSITYIVLKVKFSFNIPILIVFIFVLSVI